MIKFVTRKRCATQRVSRDDVSVTFSTLFTRKNGKRILGLRFSFSERAIRVLFNNLDDDKYLIAGQDEKNKGRIYFSPSDKKSGFKLTLNKGSKRPYTTFGDSFRVENEKSFIGAYDLQYDAENKLFFIENTMKKGDLL